MVSFSPTGPTSTSLTLPSHSPWLPWTSRISGDLPGLVAGWYMTPRTGTVIDELAPVGSAPELLGSSNVVSPSVIGSVVTSPYGPCSSGSGSSSYVSEVPAGAPPAVAVN